MMKNHASASKSSSELHQKNVDATPLSRIAEPEEVGRLITWLLSDEASYVDAEVIRVDGRIMG